jgi:hypothetical protein
VHGIDAAAIATLRRALLLDASAARRRRWRHVEDLLEHEVVLLRGAGTVTPEEALATNVCTLPPTTTAFRTARNGRTHR